MVVALALVLSSCGARSETDNLLGELKPSIASSVTAPKRITDGIASADGGRWNGSLSSVVTHGGGVQWDLGAVKPVRAAWLQADGDDYYALLGSLDGRNWTTLWEAAPTSDGGLRARESRTISGSARHLRIEPRGGDGAYALSELAVFAQVPQSWPPKMSVRVPGSDPATTPKAPLVAIVIAALLAALACLAPGFPVIAERIERVPGGRRGFALLVAGVSALLVIGTGLSYAADYRYNLVDDAYISLQYAKNLASGNGVVFNLGERVEGYTNFLWVVVLAPFWLLSGGDAQRFTELSTYLCLALAAAGLLLIADIARRLFRSLLPVALAVLLLAFDDAFVAYTTVFALENQLLIVVMLACVWLEVVKPQRWPVLLGIAFAAVCMTRPDGVLFLGAYGLAKLSVLVRPFDRRGFRELITMTATFAIVWGSYFAWRYTYYGYLLPNTFYLKVGSTFDGVQRGLEYVRSFVWIRYGVPAAVLLAALLIKQLWVRWLLAHVAIHTAYVIYVGGDFYSGHRFLMCLLPELALLIAAAVDELLARDRRPSAAQWLAAAGFAAAVAVRWGTLEQGPRVAEVQAWTNTVDNNVRYMKWLGTVTRPNASFVLGDIGAAGLFADLRVLDVFGIVDPAVAHKQVPDLGKGKAGHEKVATRAELLAKNPTYLKMGYAGSQLPPGYYLFNDFPPDLQVEGLFVRDDMDRMSVVAEGTWHLDPVEIKNWERTGTAFETSTRQARPGQGYVRGTYGHFLNSFTRDQGDRATGSIRSPTFALSGDRLRLLVGGGRDPERLRVSLLVDGQRVFSTTGNCYETLGRREWDISKFRGKSAQLEVLDEAVGAWGHIMVDEVAQLSGKPNGTGKL